MGSDTTRIDVAGVPNFWQRFKSTRNLALFLDYDGTLAPFKVCRMQAFPLPGIVEALRLINSDGETQLAIVSGRPVSEVMALLESQEFTIAGTHGYEIQAPDRGYLSSTVRQEEEALLNAAYKRAAGIVDAARVERKIATVAVHTRGLSAAVANRVIDELGRQWQIIAEDPLTEIREFNGGIEFRLKGRNKGDIVRDLLESMPCDPFAVYIGDDETDEDAFRALPAGGVGIKVGTPNTNSEASGRLASVEEVRQFLWTWVKIRLRH